MKASCFYSECSDDDCADPFTNSKKGMYWCIGTKLIIRRLLRIFSGGGTTICIVNSTRPPFPREEATVDVAIKML